MLASRIVDLEVGKKGGEKKQVGAKRRPSTIPHLTNSDNVTFISLE